MQNWLKKMMIKKTMENEEEIEMLIMLAGWLG